MGQECEKINVPRSRGGMDNWRPQCLEFRMSSWSFPIWIHSHGGTPIAGWLISWNIYLEMDDMMMVLMGTSMT